MCKNISVVSSFIKYYSPLNALKGFIYEMTIVVEKGIIESEKNN